MIWRRLSLLALVGALVFAGSACSSTLSDAATITFKDARGTHTVHISRDSFETELRELVTNKEFKKLAIRPGAVVIGDFKNSTNIGYARLLLQQDIQQVAYDEEFKALGLKIQPTDLNNASSQATDEFVPRDPQGNPIGPSIFPALPKALQDRLVQELARIGAVDTFYRSPSDAVARAYYARHEHDLCITGRLIAHISVKTRAQAEAILRRLAQGASFGDLARKDSLDTTSGRLGGVVGCPSVDPNATSPLERAAATSKLGVPSGPYESQGSFEILLVTAPYYEAFTDQIAQALSQLGSVVDRMADMKVRVDPRYGTAELRPTQTGEKVWVVIPPSAPNVRDAREPVPSTSTTTPGG